ncbi:MAG: PD-(D/E)XK nuclease family protein [Magnetococcales bacterium]|nr:PD-(D/E)XK nuclease family protein [Magnetococcales bacterium]
MNTRVLEWLRKGATAVTVNRRSARFLATAYGRWRTSLGEKVWPSPVVLPFAAWVEECWQSLLDRPPVDSLDSWPTLLSDLQERLVWEQIIVASPSGKGLLNPGTTARLAAKAWRLQRQWFPEPTEAEWQGEDSLTFRRWSRTFAKACHRNHWLDRAGLLDFLATHGHSLVWPRHLLLVGFDTFSSLEERFLQQLREWGVSWEKVDHPGAAGRPVRLTFASDRDELRAAALWAGERVRQGDSAIGVVIPDLSRRLPQVVHHFSEVFLPGTPSTPPSPPVSPPGRAGRSVPPPATPFAEAGARVAFDISLGTHLSAQPLVGDALLFLSLSQGEVAANTWSRILRSPFWAGASQEGSARARLDAALREGGLHQASLAEIGAWIGQRADAGGGGGRIAAKTLTHLAGLLEKEGEDPRHPSLWARRLERWLREMGWPGERTLDSVAAQAMQHFQNGLTTLAGLDSVLGAVSRPRILGRLAEIMDESIFQSESPVTPVHVLGSLEATAERFERLWILGLSDDLWPPPPSPNPFLPLSWQVRMALPKSSAGRELVFARNVTERLLGSANEVIVSFSASDGDRERRISPLVQHLPQVETSTLAFPQPPTYRLLVHRAAPKLLRLDDPRGPAPVITQDPVKGGAGLIRAQAQCPFQAFARYRLGAKSLVEPRPEADAAWRGTLVHAALRRLFEEVTTGEKLRALSPEARHTLAAMTSERTLREVNRPFPAPHLPPLLIPLERLRLTRLLLGWMEVESRREEPFEVMERETEKILTVGGVVVRLRIDRIDRLPGVGLVVVDYKTSQPRVGDWFGTPPAEPQMPLYLLALGAEQVAALAYAELRPGSLRHLGISARGDLLPNVQGPGVWQSEVLSPGESGGRSPWEELGQRWQASIEGLVRGFLQGEASVQPLPRACDHCDLVPLCRKWADSDADSADADGPEGGDDSAEPGERSP